MVSANAPVEAVPAGSHWNADLFGSVYGIAGPSTFVTKNREVSRLHASLRSNVALWVGLIFTHVCRSCGEQLAAVGA